MKKIVKLILITILLLIFPLGCSSDDNSTPSEQVVKEEESEDLVEEENETLLTLYIVDAPGDYVEVWVEVIGVAAVVDNDTIPLNLIWINAIQPNPEMLNLLEYTGGGFDWLVGNHEIPSGELSSVILKLGDENYLVTSDLTTHSLILTEETKNGISIPFNYSVKEDKLNELTIDFDVDASISKMEGASQDYLLDPQIRGFDNSSTGHIYGFLESELGKNPALVTVTSGDVTYSTQTYDNEFMLWGLPPGVHDLTFTFSEASGIEDLVVNDIQVIAETRTDIGPLDHSD